MTKPAWALALPLTAAATLAHAATPMGLDDARHLLARTGFGPTAAEIATFARLDRESAVARVLATTRTTALTAPPAALTDNAPIRAPREGATVEERRAFIAEQAQLGLEMRGWWMGEMLATNAPIVERMTLFWHNHFVSSQQKVRAAKLMYRQNETLRRHALGDFGALLHAASKDAAMLIYLDGVRNRRDAPNENFAREVMELFTLGEGHYTERDVKEAARAFSGWSLERDSGTFVFRRALHDAGEKTILGRTGRFDGNAVLDLLLERPETAETIVAKLWREFVSPEPDDAEVKRIAAVFRRSGYQIQAVLSQLLRSQAFWSPDNRGVLVKSPVELVVGTLRSLDAAPDDAMPFALIAAGMGQNLFSPPNVKGWRGGEAWIDSSTLLARKQFVESVARYEESSAMRAMGTTGARPALPASRALLAPQPTIDAEAGDEAQARARRIARAFLFAYRSIAFSATRWVASMPGETPASKRQAAQVVLLPIAPAGSGASISPDADALSFVRLTMLDPVYQLK